MVFCKEGNDEKAISYQKKQEEAKTSVSQINLKGVTIGGIWGSIFGFVGGFILGPVVWHIPAHTARAVYPLSLFCYVLGGLTSGLVAGKMAHSNRIINGLCAGILNLVIWDTIAPVIALLTGLTRFPEILWLWGGISATLPLSFQLMPDSLLSRREVHRVFTILLVRTHSVLSLIKTLTHNMAGVN
jgi:hypothetical protein